MNKQAYVLTREISRKRLRMLDDLRSTWKNLFGEPGKRGHYARHQWVTDDVRALCAVEKFDGVVDGRPVTIHLHRVPTREWYARELYRRALARTRARYPDFDAHHFVDGDRIGERRIVFASERHALSGHHLWTSLWLTAEEDNPLVSSFCTVEPCGAWALVGPPRKGGGSAFLPVGGGAIAVGEVAAHRLADAGDSEWRGRCDFPRECDGFGADVFEGDEPVEEADAVGLLTVDALPREEQFQRSLLAHEGREEHGEPKAVMESELGKVGGHTRLTAPDPEIG